jgi:hypothetical protein
MRINLYFREEGDGRKARHNCPPPNNGQDIYPRMICRKEERIREKEPDERVHRNLLIYKHI